MPNTKQNTIEVSDLIIKACKYDYIISLLLQNIEVYDYGDEPNASIRFYDIDNLIKSQEPEKYEQRKREEIDKYMKKQKTE